MSPLRRQLRQLNWARVLAVSALLFAAFTIEVMFVPQRPLQGLYLLSAAVYGAVLFYAVIDRLSDRRPWLARLQPAIQVGGDAMVVAGFVVASGGALSPLSALFALPVMLSAAVWGKRGGVCAAGGAWCLYGLLLARDVLSLPPSDLPVGRVSYAAVSHFVGFVLLGALGGTLADRLRAANREIDEQRGHLALLREQQALIVESINTGLLTTRAGGVIGFVNRAGLEILGEPPERVQGRDVTDVFGLPGGFLGEVWAAQRAGTRCRFERRWTRPSDGEELFLGFSVTPLRPPAGRAGGPGVAPPDGPATSPSVPDGWLVTFQDLTEIASLEAQVRTRERMAALGEMAAGMAHELRNPLTAISGCVQMLGVEVPEARRGLAEVALRESERLNRIIRDFLEFARPGPFRPRPVEAVSLMEEMARLFRKRADFTPAHRIEVVGRTGPRPAFADPDRLRQVFWNLAGNALKAMPDGGTVAIEVAPAGPGEVQIAFRDQGEGMDEETLARLFEPFHGRFREGSGLGAAIVYRIAEEHGGRVQVVSRPRKGTEIRVILPAAEPADGASVPATGGIAGAAREDTAAAAPETVARVAAAGGSGRGTDSRWA